MRVLLQTAELLELFGEAVECRSDGPCSPEFNMRCDWERLQACARSPEIPPLLRFYAWRPWAVSLGMHQREDALDLERCHQHGIAVVRRPTGGRAVLHAEEITYAVVVRLGHRTPQELYQRIHQRIAIGLTRLSGHPIALAPTTQSVRHPWHRRSAACFTSFARSELSLEGRKLVGSAQRILQGVVLQHGSILLGDAHLLLADLLAVGTEAEREALRSWLAARSASLQSITGRLISYSEAVAALWESFCGVPFPGQTQETVSGIGSSSA
ncbi:Octanoyltransferase LipM [bacterium HR21]|jgi:lipoate-protein ligase A|nr:Octanoyltransferase LipM [bacterium HR21]